MKRSDKLYKEIISTEVVTEDAFQDRFQLPAGEYEAISKGDLGELWSANPIIYTILKMAPSLERAREQLYNYLNEQERWVFDVDNDLHPLEKSTVRECARTFKSIIGPINEKRTKTSAIKHLYDLVKKNGNDETPEISRGFILEFLHLFKGVAGLSGIYSESGVFKKEVPSFIKMDGIDAAKLRSDQLDIEEQIIEKYTKKYPTGLDPEVIKQRKLNKKRILKYFKASEKDWLNYHWHYKNIIRNADTLKNLIEISEEDNEAINLANRYNIPFGITPYYVSLMDYDASRTRDHSVRAQVIPPLHYVQLMAKHRHNRSEALDFMGEHDTSPIPLITRRYPQIAILKPYNSCPQICVYCQRNWEINEVLDPGAMATPRSLEKALAWFENHPSIQDILITGGDPIVPSNKRLKPILDRIAGFPHIKRIRIGTRIPITLPFRFNDDLINLLSSYHVFGKREVAIVTHVQHVWEITPECIDVIKKIKMCGINVYNQAVYTFENSRKFEMVALRQLMRLCGIDPYYTFNAKGKEETRDYRVPIARLLQERKEEARLIPGLDRTDEPVFNVPRLGKNHIRAWQDHRVVMILPDGRRVYEFHPWEKNIKPVPLYNHTDVAIWDYLKMLKKHGEDIHDYRTIWYYY